MPCCAISAVCYAGEEPGRGSSRAAKPNRCMSAALVRWRCQLVRLPIYLAQLTGPLDPSDWFGAHRKPLTHVIMRRHEPHVGACRLAPLGAAR